MMRAELWCIQSRRVRNRSAVPTPPGTRSVRGRTVRPMVVACFRISICSRDCGSSCPAPVVTERSASSVSSTPPEVGAMPPLIRLVPDPWPLSVHQWRCFLGSSSRLKIVRNRPAVIDLATPLGPRIERMPRRVPVVMGVKLARCSARRGPSTRPL